MDDNTAPPDEEDHRQRPTRSDGSGGRVGYHRLRDDSILYRELVNTIQDAVVVTDTDRQIIDCNRAFTDRFGYALDEIAGRRIDALYADTDGSDTVTEGVIAHADDPTVTRTITYETRGGATFPGETDVVCPRDDTGEVVAFVGLIREVSERTEHKRDCEKTVEFLQSLYDVATDKTADTDQKITRLLELGSKNLDLPDGYLTRIELATPDGTHGTQRVIEASGDYALLQPGSACPLADSYCRKTIAANGLMEVYNAVEAGWEGDPAYERFDLGCYIGTTVTVGGELYGTVFFAEVSPREEPFSDAERTFVRLMSQLVERELEQDQARRELEQQNERLQEFASIVSHDLRNPLNVAQGRLELAREECDNEHLERVAGAHQRMVDLIDDLLTLARDGEDAVDQESVHLGDCCEAWWRNVETADAELVTDVDRRISADRRRLQQLLENLYRNAVEHSSTGNRTESGDSVEHGSTSSRTESDDSVEHGGDDVTVTVGTVDDGFYIEDDGSGIPETEREEVFETGYSTSETGTGFGLSIVEQVVEAHGWDVRVTDGSEGGARFEITGVQFAAE